MHHTCQLIGNGFRPVGLAGSSQSVRLWDARVRERTPAKRVIAMSLKAFTVAGRITGSLVHIDRIVTNRTLAVSVTVILPGAIIEM